MGLCREAFERRDYPAFVKLATTHYLRKAQPQQHDDILAAGGLGLATALARTEHGGNPYSYAYGGVMLGVQQHFSRQKKHRGITMVALKPRHAMAESTVETKLDVERALAHLPARTAEVVQRIYVLEHHRDAVAADLGISQARVGQIARQGLVLMRLFMTMRCKLHPTYRAMRPPTSTAPNCTCRAIYNAAKRARSGK